MSKPVNITFNINTPDAASFRRSQHQLLARANSRFNLLREREVPSNSRLMEPPVAPSLVVRAGRMISKIVAGETDWK